MRRFKFIGIAGVVAAGFISAAPAAAQKMGEGYEFPKAVKARDGNKVTAALDKPGSTVIGTRDASTGESALHYVVARRDLVWLRFLIGRGANPNIADRNGVTPLTLAANLGWSEGVEQLVKSGAGVDSASQTGETPLIAAIHRRDAEMVRALLKAGANPDRADNSGRTARDYAVLIGPQSALLAEIDKTKAERKARAAKSYGPGS